MITVKSDEQTIEERPAIRKPESSQLAPIDHQFVISLIAEADQLRAEINNSTSKQNALSRQWRLILKEARSGKSESINWPALAEEIRTTDERRAYELTCNAMLGAFNCELVNFLDGYCGRLRAFVDAHPNLDGECRESLDNAIWLNARRLTEIVRPFDDIPF